MDQDETVQGLRRELAEARQRLDEANQTLHAIRTGEVDAVIIESEKGSQLYTLKPSTEPYRHIVEQMQEAAVTITADGLIVFCNESLSRLFGLARGHVVGSSLSKYIAPEALRRLVALPRTSSHELKLIREDNVVIECIASSIAMPIDGETIFCIVLTDLTRQRLRLSHDAIVLATSDAVYQLSPDLVIETWNPGATTMFGYTESEAIGRSDQELSPASERAALSALFAEATAVDRAVSADVIRQRKHGELFNVILSLAPLRDMKGALTGYAAIAHDITERKAAERAMKANAETFRHLVENSPFGVFVINADFRLVQVSLGAQKIFSQVRPLIGRDFADVLRCLWPESAASELIARYRHTLETGDAFAEANTVGLRKDIGAVEAYDWRIERLRLPDGRFGVVCHFYDFTERQQYEVALRQSEMRFRGTFENAAVGVGHVDLEGHFLEVNHRLCDILGCEKVDVHRKRLWEITQDGNNPISDDVAQDLFSGESASFSVDLSCIRKDGNPVWVGLTVTVQRDAQGAPQYFIVILRDISRRMEAQAHQQFLFRELAHRLKNQLSIIQGMAGQTARGAASLSNFQQTFGERLRGLAVSTDLLLAQNWGDAPLAELVQRQVKSFVPTGDRFLYEGPEVSVTSDAAQAIGLALHELATNCVKYGAWSQSAGTLKILWAIEDNGSEPRLSLTWIERGGPAVAPPTNTGFGQIVTKQMVAQKLNGTVDICYEPEGLTWTLKIPRSAYTLKERSKLSVSGKRNVLHH